MLSALIDRKWSKSAPILKMQGFPVTVSSDDEVEAGPTDEEVGQAAIRYTINAREGGRNPSFDEVFQVIQGQLGSDAVLSRGQFSIAMAEACAAVPALILPIVPPVRDTHAEAVSGVQILIEADPERVLDVPAVVLLAKAEFPDSAKAVTDTLVQGVIKDMRSLWARDEVRLRQDARKWLAVRYQQYKDTGTGWPSWEQRSHRDAIFGRFPDWSVSTEARGMVYGAWAASNMCYPKQALGILIKIRPDLSLPEDFTIKEEIEAGLLHGILMTQGSWLTTERAVREYADIYFPIPVPDVEVILQAPAAVVETLTALDVVEAAVVEDTTLTDSPPISHPTAQETDLYALADLIETGIGSQIRKAHAGTDNKIHEVEKTLADIAGAVEALKETTASVVEDATKEVTSKVQHFLSGAKVTLADSDRKIIRAIVDHALEPLVRSMQAVSSQVSTLASGVSNSHMATVKSMAGLKAGQDALAAQVSDGFKMLAFAIQGIQATQQSLSDQVAAATPDKSGGRQPEAPEGLDAATLNLAKTIQTAEGAEVRIFVGKANRMD